MSKPISRDVTKPAKKVSRAALITTVVIAIILLIVVIILVILYLGKTYPACPTTASCIGCVSNTDCSGSVPTCNTTTHLCY